MNRKIIILLVAIIVIIIATVLVLFSEKMFVKKDPYNVEVIDKEIAEKIDYGLCNDQWQQDCLNGEVSKCECPNKRTYLYLPNYKLEAKLGEIYGLAFGIKNNYDETNFRWIIESDKPNPGICPGFSQEDINSWIILNRESAVNILNDQIHIDIIRFKSPEKISGTCLLRYRLKVYHGDEEIYGVETFDVDIKK